MLKVGLKEDNDVIDLLMVVVVIVNDLFYLLMNFNGVGMPTQIQILNQCMAFC
jgi:hypothetical protein